MASLFITLTEITYETHYVAKKKKHTHTKTKTKTNKKQDKTVPIGFALSV